MTDTPERMVPGEEVERAFEDALVAPEYQPLCRVKWQQGGWIFWNWKTATWDDVVALRAARARGETHVKDGE